MTTMRFNHMELTLPSGALDPTTRKEIGRFYEEVFGWAPLDVEILGQNALLLPTDPEVSQFVLVAESDRPMASPGFDHLGLLLDTREEVDVLLEKCRAYRARDPRVAIKEYDDLDQGVVVVHAFYVKYLLPIWFDVQCQEYAEAHLPARQWRFA